MGYGEWNKRTVLGWLRVIWSGIRRMNFFLCVLVILLIGIFIFILFFKKVIGKFFIEVI